MDEIIVENIGSQIAYDMPVFDSTGAKIGTVQQYDLTNGWFMTEKGVFFPQDRYIPFSAISQIGPSGIYLSVTKGYVKDMYDRPPMVDVDVVAGPAGAAAVGTVTSGYNGSRVVVNASTISQAIERLDNGLKVFDANGEKVGRVYDYVPGSDWIVVEKGMFSSRDLYVPVTAIDYIDGDGVYLRVTKDVLQSAFVTKPATVNVDVVATSSGAVAAVSSAPYGVTGDRIVVDSTTLSVVVEHLGKGPKVYDLDGKDLGRVTEYDPVSGWMVVEKGLLFPKDLYIPVTAVDYLDDKGVHLRVTKDVLANAFVVAPANVNLVDVDVVATQDGTVAAVSTVQDGSAGDRVVVDSTNLSLAVERLGKGPKVYDLEDKDLGRVTQYDPASGWMVVEKGVLFPKDLYIPVTAVDYLDEKGVHLRVTKDVLANAFLVQPANVTFVATVV